MKAPNISNIFRGRLFLDDLDFLRVNMNPIFIDYKTHKDYTINTKYAFLSICVKLVVPQSGENNS